MRFSSRFQKGLGGGGGRVLKKFPQRDQLESLSPFPFRLLLAPGRGGGAPRITRKRDLRESSNTTFLDSPPLRYPTLPPYRIYGRTTRLRLRLANKKEKNIHIFKHKYKTRYINFFFFTISHSIQCFYVNVILCVRGKSSQSVSPFVSSSKKIQYSCMYVCINTESKVISWEFIEMRFGVCVNSISAPQTTLPSFSSL